MTPNTVFKVHLIPKQLRQERSSFICKRPPVDVRLEDVTGVEGVVAATFAFSVKLSLRGRALKDCKYESEFSRRLVSSWWLRNTATNESALASFPTNSRHSVNRCWIWITKGFPGFSLLYLSYSLRSLPSCRK